MTLPRNVLHWPDDARHELAERAAMRVEHVRRPLTATEEAELQAWAEQVVRESWWVRKLPPSPEDGAALDVAR